MRLILELLFYLFIYGAILAGLPGMLAFGVARWCSGRFGRPAQVVLTLALAALGIGLVYGLLRLSGAVLLPGDNTSSYNFFDASWRDDGIDRILLCGGPFVGIAAALWAGQRAERQQREEATSNGKQPDGAG